MGQWEGDSPSCSHLGKKKAKEVKESGLQTGQHRKEGQRWRSHLPHPRPFPEWPHKGTGKEQKGGNSAWERKSSSSWTYASRVWTLPFLNLGKLTEVANKMRRGHRRVFCKSKTIHHTRARRVLAFPAILWQSWAWASIPSVCKVNKHGELGQQRGFIRK